MLLDMNGKFTLRKIKSSGRKVLFSIRSYCQFLGVSPGISVFVVSVISSSNG